MTEAERPPAVGAGREGDPVAPIDEGFLVHARYGIVLCEIEEWIEDGLRVVSAKDFDLIAVGQTERGAIDQFVVEVKSLVEGLHVVIQRDEATQDEKELYLRLVEPLTSVLEREAEDMRRMLKRMERQLIAFPRLRRKRGQHQDVWRHASSRENLKQRSLA